MKIKAPATIVASVVIILIILSIIVNLRQGETNLTLDQETQESNENTNEDKYLDNILQYIEENNIDIKPANEESYAIKDIKEGNFEGQNVIIIELNCCFMGDTAYLDKETGEVIHFYLGDQ